MKKKPTKKRVLSPEQKKIHRLRQKVYLIRKKIDETEDSKQLMRLYRQQIELNSEQERVRNETKIHRRRSKAEIKAFERSGKMEGIEKAYFFYDAMKVKEYINQKMADGIITTVNGLSAKKSPIKALAAIEDLFDGLNSEKCIKFIIDPSSGSGKCVVWTVEKDTVSEDEISHDLDTNKPIDERL